VTELKKDEKRVHAHCLDPNTLCLGVTAQAYGGAGVPAQPQLDVTTPLTRLGITNMSN